MHFSITLPAATLSLTLGVLALSPVIGEQAVRSDPATVAAPGRVAAAGSAAKTDPVLRLALDGGTKTTGDVLYQLHNSGRASVSAVVVTRNGGSATRVPGRRVGWAARLPAHSYQQEPPRASIRVRATGTHDPFSPGRRDFRFGADFRLDSLSQGSPLDNGDNLVQRGLFGQAGQYKVQVDSRVPLCRIKGVSGAVVARTKAVQPLQWYRTRCLRHGEAVTIRVWTLTPSGPVHYDSATARGSIGSVTFPRTRPLSVGGKLDDDGDVVAGSSDQFNGVVDEIVYSLSG